MMVAVPPIRARLGDGPRTPIPLTYPSMLCCLSHGRWLGLGGKLWVEVLSMPANVHLNSTEWTKEDTAGLRRLG